MSMRLLLSLLLACICSVIYANNFKHQTSTISQVWLSDKTPGSFSSCDGGRTETSFELLNKESSFFSTTIPNSGYFFYAGKYTLVFECVVTQYAYNKITSKKSERFEVDANLIGGKVYNAMLNINYDDWSGCNVEFNEKI